MDYKHLSKAVSYFLRHSPWEIELEPDAAGWVLVKHLLKGLRPKFPKVTAGDLETIIETSDKIRFEIKGDKIRATYGHSLARKIEKKAGTPPAILYHGTAIDKVDLIMDVGLLPMNRQYVHLSSDRNTAKVVGSRKGRKVVVMVIDASSAHDYGIQFYEELNGVWLTDHIPADFLNPTFN